MSLATGSTWRLNRLGAAVWQQLDRGADIEAIVSELQQEYSVEVETLRRDVLALVSALWDHGLLDAAP